MPNPGTKIGTCLWFDRNAEEAAEFYVSLFADSRIVSMTRYGKAGPVRRKMVSGTFSEKENEKENGVRNLFCDLMRRKMVSGTFSATCSSLAPGSISRT